MAKKREPAPVVMYFEKDRNQRLIERTRELLNAKQIPFTALDVSGDPATLAFVMREAACEDDDLPVVFVAGAPVGGFNELVDCLCLSSARRHEHDVARLENSADALSQAVLRDGLQVPVEKSGVVSAGLTR